MSDRTTRAHFRLYLVTDRQLAAANGGLLTVIERALAAVRDLAPPGTVAVQLREKDLGGRELCELAGAIRWRCLRFGAPLLINDRLDIALALEADGVHLPADSFEVNDARNLLGSERLIGVSTHSASEVSSAATAGADFAVFGPVYQPISKAAYGPARGVEALGCAVEAGGSMPVYALGGITARRIAELGCLEHAARPSGSAVIGAVFGASDPAAAVRELLVAWQQLQARPG